MSSTIEFTGSIPATYDRYLGPLFFEPYALNLVGRIPQQQKRVLELACGTGRVTRHLTGKITEDGVLFATDLNPDMLEVAKHKINDPKLRWQVVDAHELPFEDQEFDLVVCQFGVMFFQDKEKAFKETYRVLKPSGIFLFNTWDDVQFNTVSAITQEVLNDILGKEAPDFLEKGPYSMYDKKQIKDLVLNAGFKDITIEPVLIVSSEFSAEDAAEGILSGSPLAGYLQEKNAPKEEIRQRLVADFNKRPENSPMTMQALACLCNKSEILRPNP